MSWEEKLRGRLGKLEWPETGRIEGMTSVLALVGWNREARREEILLLKRSELVETHKGQVAFPGGYRESDDLDLLHTALRETEEEIGVKREHVRVLGRLTPVETRGGVLIHPWVGTLELPYPFVLNPGEVDRLLFLPVAQLLEEELRELEVAVGNFKVTSIGLYVDEELVWGATARMLKELREALVEAFRP